MMRISKKKGFTLIELLVVVAIIGILAAIALPKLFGAICKAKVGNAMGTFGALNSAMAMYYADKQQYYSSAGVSFTFLVNTYMNNAPALQFGNSYVYKGDANTYTICLSTGVGCDASVTTDDYLYYSSLNGIASQSSACP